MHFEQTWRWFGNFDTIPLESIRQTGVTGIVSALHHIPHGEVWPVEEIQRHKDNIESQGLTWSVVESVPVHEDIKKQSGDYRTYIKNYQQSIRNLAECGITTVCYNFMPLTDWTRTDIDHPLDNGATALKFDATAFAAFELFILNRVTAVQDYSIEQQHKATDYYEALNSEQINFLTKTILLGLPGDVEMSLDLFRELLGEYREIDEQQLRSNLYDFLEEIIPVAEENGVRMAIHPDDPPFSLFGLPRIVSTESDARRLLKAVDSPANGLTFCTGSYGAHPDNDLPGMIHRLGGRIHFIHLRNVLRFADGSFREAPHLEGDVNMPDVMRALIEEQLRRAKQNREDVIIPMRPDHGPRLLDDLQKESYPGYSGLGRLRGLAELRGLEMGIRSMLPDPKPNKMI